MNKIKLTISTIVFLFLSSSIIFAQRPLVYSKGKPIQMDFDMENSKKPKSIKTGYLYDLIDGTIFQPVRRNADLSRYIRKIVGKKKESINVNVLDEVPNSSWFTNRMGFQKMSLDELRRGPNSNNGPRSGKLTVIKGKAIGVTPGFWIKDKTGEIYILKFDPPKYPELATGAEVIGTKMFHAFGYNVPENHIFRFRREDLEISEDAKFTDEKNKKVKMTVENLNLILSQVARQSDGQYRSVASRLIKGTPIGGFTFSGKRKDDANDIIPHEIRRDIRALKVFSAWTEHNDLRVGNTLDMYVDEDGRKFIRHFLIDFGSTFGSDSIQPNAPEVGREHGLDYEVAAKVLFSAGTYQPAWRNKKHIPVFSPAIGRYSTRSFRPNKWKSNFTLAALGQMTALDGYWAARIISEFTPEQIRAIVETAEFSNQADTDYLTNEIIARQHIIVRHYAGKRVGLGKFSIKNDGDLKKMRFRDYRFQFPTEKIINNRYIYSVQTLGKKPKVLIRGKLSDPEIEFDQKIIKKIAEVGNSAQNRGVAKLTLRRLGEKQRVEIFLWSKDGKSLEISGIVH